MLSIGISIEFCLRSILEVPLIVCPHFLTVVQGILVDLSLECDRILKLVLYNKIVLTQSIIVRRGYNRLRRSIRWKLIRNWLVHTVVEGKILLSNTLKELVSRYAISS